MLVYVHPYALSGLMFIYVVNRALPYATAVSPSDFLSIDTSLLFLVLLVEVALND